MKLLSKLIHLFGDPLYRNSFYITLSSFYNSGISFSFWVIAAKLYPEKFIGVAAASISTIMFLVIAAKLGLDFSLIRFFPEGNKDIVFSTSILTVMMSSTIAGVLFILYTIASSKNLMMMNSYITIPIFILIFISMAINTIIGVTFIALRRAKYFFLQNLLGISRVLLLIPMAYFKSLGILLAFGLSFILTSAISLFLVLKLGIKPKFNLDTSFLRRTFKFSAGNYISNLFIVIPNRVLPIIVLSVLGPVQSAYYYMAFSIASFIYAVPNAIGMSLLVEGSHGSPLKQSLKKSIYVSFLIIISIIALVFLFGDLILGAIGKNYSSAGFSLLKLMSISGFLVAGNYMYFSVLRIKKRVKMLVVLSCLISCSILCFSYIFMHIFGLIGIGYAWLVSYGFGILLILFIEFSATSASQQVKIE